MPTSNFDDQNDDNTLLTLFFPALATGAVFLPALYLAVVFAGSMPMLPILLGVALALAITLLHVDLRGEKGLLRWLALILNLGFPLLFILLGIVSRKGELLQFGGLLLACCGLAWVPLFMVREATGGVLQRLRQPGEEERPRSFSCAMIILVLIVGSLIFLFGESNAQNSGRNSFVVLLFAIPFSLICLSLLSLYKLVRRTFDTPGKPIALSADFVQRWMVTLMVVLLACCIFALIPPKPPLKWLTANRQQNTQEPYSPGVPGLRQVDTPPAGDRGNSTRSTPAPAKRPGSSTNEKGKNGVPGKNGSPSRDAEPPSIPGDGGVDGPQGTGTPDSHGPSEAKHTTKQPGKGPSSSGTSSSGKGKGTPQVVSTPPSAKRGPLLWRVADKILDQAAKVAFAGEGQQRVTPGTEPAADAPTVVMITREQVRAKARSLVQLLRENPVRLAKVVLTALALVSCIILPIVYLRRMLKRRKQRLAEAALELLRCDPFLDPFTQPVATSQERIEAIYRTFLAYLWLLDIERKPAQTEFNLAEWLIANDSLDSDAVWVVTRAYTQGRYAATPLSDAELAQVRAALATIIADVTARVPDDERERKMEAYRSLLATQRTKRRRAPFLR